ncbi:MAG: HNH endonuclease signature motif containing protein, partial [Polyangiaceae bacterium]
YGLVCPRCDRRVRRYADLHVDHIRSIKNGGEPWRSNAQILCSWCNLDKGPNSTFIENFLGR